MQGKKKKKHLTPKNSHGMKKQTLAHDVFALCSDVSPLWSLYYASYIFQDVLSAVVDRAMGYRC